MKLTIRPLVVAALLGAFSLLVLSRAQAGGGHFFPPVSDPVVKEECGSCHLAFPPSMLPARSWQRMMGDLKNHFGDDASLDPPVAARIADYLQAHAAESGGVRRGEKLIRGLAADAAPLRITELPKWRREHRKVPERDWQHPDVRTRANCIACHADAERGYYDE